jgi:RND family efflux transporter MFP subunit
MLNILYLAFILVIYCSGQQGYAAEYECIVEAVTESTLSFAEPGVIAAIKVKVGDRVKKGQILVAQESKTLESLLAVAKHKKQSTAKLSLAQAVQQQKKQQVDRLLALQTEGIVKPFEVEQAESELVIATAEIQVIQEQQQLNELEYKQLQARLEERSLRSPMDGMVTQVHKSIAEWVGNNDAPVLTLANTDKLKVVVHIPTAQASLLVPSQTVDIRFPNLKFAAMTAKIARLAPTVDANSDTISVTIQFDNPDKKLRSGVKCLVYVTSMP